MIVGYDPIAREIDLDFEDGSHRWTIPADHLLVKAYCDPGVLFVELTGDLTEAGLVEMDGEAAVISIQPLGKLVWRVETTSRQEG